MTTKTYEQYKTIAQSLQREYGDGQFPEAPLNALLAQFITGNRYLHRNHIRNMADLKIIGLGNAPGTFVVL